MRVIYVSRIQAIRTLVVLVLVIISIIYTQTTQYDVISVFLNTKRELPIYSVETDEKKIAISFDAAWGAVKLFRPPFGDYNDRLILTCREMGYYPIQWDVELLDTKVKHGNTGAVNYQE